ncbi:MAG: TPM domain-containing protein, partial [Chitinophagales bacterium]
MRKLVIPCILFLLFPPVFAQSPYTIETVPNPKETYGGFVSNPDNVILPTTVESLNGALQTLENSTTVQVVVVILNSVGDEVPGEFRTRLFNYWGVGQKEKDNGLLILMVMDQRRIEFETGYGLEPILTDAICKRIQMEYMIPLAKEGKFDECITIGVDQVIAILTNPAYRDEVYDYSAENYEYLPWWRRSTGTFLLITFFGIYGISALSGFLSRNKKLKSAPNYVKNYYSDSYSKSKFALLNVGVPVAFVAWQQLAGTLRLFEFAIFIYGLMIVLLLEKRFRLNKYILKDAENDDPQYAYNKFARSHSKGWGAASVFFPVPFLFYSIFNKSRMRNLRNSPPLAADGSTLLVKLDELKDDGFLKAFELTEEKLRSVDYDVWKHPLTNEIKIFRFENYLSKYKECPNCKAKAYLMVKNETVVA